MKINNLISRLEGAKKTGAHSWICKCPAHQDRTASLHIKNDGDDKILLNCFAGCDTYSILKSIGLDWKDVLPDSNEINHSSPKKQIIYATEALALIRFEAQIVCLIAFKMKKTRIASDDAVDRLELAMQRINKAMEASNV
jgi:hypothetical protein